MNPSEPFELAINGAPPQMVGAICQGFVCEALHIEGRLPAPANVSYLKFNGAWHRLYFEFRCIFWHRTEKPLPWEDDEPWTEYVNLAEKFGIVGQRLVTYEALATAKGCDVTFAFANGLKILIQDSDDRTSFEVTGYVPTGALG